MVAIGNGTACRQTEEIVSEVVQNELASQSVQYVLVNEAGANAYSTSETGTEELTEQTPLERSAISIGRRLLDPLAELVKITPSNVGVGLYQHDVKSKHLSDSLLEVVRDCVNLVGVDVNAASPYLLSHVAGLNQLTARRIVEFRNEKGPFKNREQLKEVAGIGDTTYVQAAGFLRIYGGDNALDETAIHPENYDVARKILERIGATEEDLRKRITPQATLNSATASPSENGAATTAEAATELTEKTTAAEAASETGTVTETVESKPEAVAAPEPQTKPTPKNDALKKIREGVKGLDTGQLASEFSIGTQRLGDLLKAIKHPTHDPRQSIGAPIFRNGIVKIDDLSPGMKLASQVVNVVGFGVFVDIGMGVSCLVHISQLSNRFVKDLHLHYCVGDRLNVWVKEIDQEKKRVVLTAVSPDAGKPKRKPQPNKRSDRGPRNQGQGKHRGGNKKNFRKEYTSKRPPKARKPVKPISDEMLAGDKPMRSFSDLAQFFDKSKDKKK